MKFPAFFTVLLFASLASAECYYPDGSLGSGLIPYNTEASVTHCCRESDVPLSNGLCFSSGLNAVVRRGCTDKAWNSTACPNICIAEPFKNGDAVMTPCGAYGTFCCGQDGDARSCCESGNGTFQIAGGEPQCNATQTIFSTTTVSATPTATGNLATSTATVSCSASDTSVEKLRADLKSKQNVTIALATVFGVSMAVLIAASVFWARERKRLNNDSIELRNLKARLPMTLLEAAKK
ncbi:hypothetical protein BDV96DRAFT_626464 [Lophiotrema nucula]|uniref:Mid2 domain-containing protein n=1 Tax=Lophiotrema nucula TaxID=690887 RepID=A0A6A5ZW30_9PLEO|nr:hypothetical protein BDV96DRAFT_626464 [Lophiotrema nucula]